MANMLDVLQNVWVVHANGLITIWMFFKENVSMLLMLLAGILMAWHEIQDSEDLFASDERKLL